jgi:hypothetical protein
MGCGGWWNRQPLSSTSRCSAGCCTWASTFSMMRQSSWLAAESIGVAARGRAPPSTALEIHGDDCQRKHHPRRMPLYRTPKECYCIAHPRNVIVSHIQGMPLYRTPKECYCTAHPRNAIVSHTQGMILYQRNVIASHVSITATSRIPIALLERNTLTMDSVTALMTSHNIPNPNCTPRAQHPNHELYHGTDDVTSFIKARTVPACSWLLGAKGEGGTVPTQLAAGC